MKKTGADAQLSWPQGCRPNLVVGPDRRHFALATAFACPLVRSHLNGAYYRRNSHMSWKTPKIVEIALGAEINSYACAGLK